MVHLRLALSTIVLVTVLTQASAVQLLNQGPDTGTIVGSYGDVTDYQQLADSIVFHGNATIESITHYQLHLGVATGPSPTRVVFYDDDNGKPGDVLWTEDVVSSGPTIIPGLFLDATQVCKTSLVLSNPFLVTPEKRFWLSTMYIGPETLGAGTLTIARPGDGRTMIRNLPNNLDWQWGNAGPNQEIGDIMLELEGTGMPTTPDQMPEPASIIILLSGSAIVVQRWGRKRSE